MLAWKPSFDFYETSLEGRRAIVMLDLGAVRYTPVNTHPTLLQIRVAMLQPREDGLRSTEEADALFALEKKLTEVLEQKAQALYIGRVVTHGSTEFYFYVPFASPASTDGPGAMVGDVAPYTLEWSARNDSGWECYDQLFPNTYAMQTISNRMLQRAMVQQGDQLDIPRRVEHVALFTAKERSEAAGEALKKAGFEVTTLERGRRLELAVSPRRRLRRR